MSPFGRSAIGVIRIAGADAEGLIQGFLRRKISGTDGKIHLRGFTDSHGTLIDQVLIVKLPNAENIYEITTHGGVRILQRIIETFERAGAKLIEAMDLIAETYQIDNPVTREAYNLLPSAKTTLAAKFLLHQAHDGLSRFFDIPDAKLPAEVFQYWPAIRHLLDGIKIVITGPANVGKSTLLNGLSEIDHALVADIPGTTRDYVTARIEIDGLPAELVDTAGLGDTSDPLERLASRQTRLQLENADVVLSVFDASSCAGANRFLCDIQKLIKPEAGIIILLNKIDRGEPSFSGGDFPENYPCLKISALKQTNLKDINELVIASVGLKGFDYRKPAIFADSLLVKPTEAEPAR